MEFFFLLSVPFAIYWLLLLGIQPQYVLCIFVYLTAKSMYIMKHINCCNTHVKYGWLFIFLVFELCGVTSIWFMNNKQQTYIFLASLLCVLVPYMVGFFWTVKHSSTFQAVLLDRHNNVPNMTLFYVILGWVFVSEVYFDLFWSGTLFYANIAFYVCTSIRWWLVSMFLLILSKQFCRKQEVVRLSKPNFLNKLYMACVGMFALNFATLVLNGWVITTTNSTLLNETIQGNIDYIGISLASSFIVGMIMLGMTVVTIWMWIS